MNEEKATPSKLSVFGKRLAGSDAFKAMFREEANLSGMLQHQNIVQIFGNGEFNDYLFLTMEFVDGKNVAPLTTFPLGTSGMSRWSTR